MKRNRVIHYVLSVALFLTTVLGGAFAYADSGNGDNPDASELQAIRDVTTRPPGDAEADRYIVKIDSGRVDELDEDAVSDYTSSAYHDIILVDQPEDALDFADPEIIESIEPDYKIFAMDFPEDGIPNDPYWADSEENQWYYWNRTATCASINASAIYRRGLDGSGVKVAVLDSGLQMHSDFKRDYAANGLDFTGLGDGQTPTPGAFDGYGHGTGVSSLIVAATNNNSHIAGLTDGVDLVPYKILDDSGHGYLSTIYLGIEYMHKNGLLPDVMNLSVGTTSKTTPSPAQNEIMNLAIQSGTIIVSSAANFGTMSGSPDFVSYPAGYDNVITVANSTRDGKHNSISNENDTVDVSAPGTNILFLNKSGGRSISSGTSYASPIVAGVAAALKQYDRTIDTGAFLELIKKTSVKITDADAFSYNANGRSKSFGYGLIDAAAMFDYISSAGVHRVLLDPEGGQFDGDESALEYYEAGTTAALPAKVTKASCLFDGWYLEGDPDTRYTALSPEITAGLSPNQAIKLHAGWRNANVTIHFDAAGGAPVTPVLFSGRSILPTLPTPVREGYVFLGWYCDGRLLEAGAPVPSAGPFNAVAKWRKKVVGLSILSPKNILAPAEAISLTARSWGDLSESEKAVNWSVDHPEIAVIDKAGRLVGVSEGTVTVSAALSGSSAKTTSSAFTVAKNVTGVRTPLTKLYLKKGKAMMPPVCADSVNAVTKKPDTAAKLEWTSSNAKIAAVNKTTGKITPKKTGKATITAKALNGKKCTIKVYVVKKAKTRFKGSLVRPPKSLKKGKTAILKIKVTPSNATNLLVKFKSSKPSVISVDKAGKLTAKKKGKAVITVKIGKKIVKKKITVK
ncbi:MAG: S8 family serine peptidase [Clostridiales Family XIII bacterium]|nr:S8 family serine peptidase [Clostridiales Family XIII bacterium]